MKKIVLYICWILISLPAAAQLCTGSLGDPSVLITFGTGTSSNSGVAGNNYSFVSKDCPNDGSYTIRSTTSSCFGGSWHNISEDHTPSDVNGNFMLVNASYTPGVFYLDTVGGLCEGTTYEFATWMVNVLKSSACGGTGIQPNLSFSIETTSGTVLATYNSGNIPSTSTPIWKQYGLYFTTPPGVSRVVIRLTNNAPGGCGNDLALDDISFRPCGPKVNASVKQHSSSNLEVCEGDQSIFELTADIGNGYVNPVFQWQLSTDSGRSWNYIPNANTLEYVRTPTNAGVYYYRLSVSESANAQNSSCRVSSNEIHVTVHPLPKPAPTVNEPVCEGDTITLRAVDADNYSWTGPGGFSSNGAVARIYNASQSMSGVYKVLAVTAAGCSNEGSVEVNVSANPNASAGADQAFCEGLGVNLQGSGGTQYEWTPVSGLSNSHIASPYASPADTTLYTLTVYNDRGCSDRDSVQVNVLKLPRASAGTDLKIMEGDQVMLNGSASGSAITYAWYPPAYLDNPNSLQPMASPVSDMIYTLRVESTLGCGVAEDKVFIRVFKKVDVPNAFSPNGDGIHDYWRLRNIETYPEAEIKVFNRYGQPVYEGSGNSTPWDGTLKGKPLPIGAYFYVIDLKNDFPLLKGAVNIIR